MKNQPAIINVLCFIVPNEIRRFGALKFVKDSHAKALANIGITNLSDDTILAQVRVDRHGIDLTNHGWGEALCNLFGIPWDAKHPTYLERDAPHFLPLDLIQDVHDGDTKDFVTKTGAIVRMRFSELDSIYCRFGRFEDVRDTLAKNFFKQSA